MVQRETSGNPFFLGEVLRHLAETGALYERDGRWVSDLRPEEAGIPEGIREVVGRRLSRLGDDVETVLRSAAVIGYEFDVDLLADVVGRDADDVLDALDIAARANLVIEVGVDRHRFAHALVRETLHGELSSSRRARQHRRVAEALEARHADDLDAVVAELATHWAEASAGGDPTRAIELAIRAGDLAADRGAFENAVRWFEQALELIDDDDNVERSAALRRQTLIKMAQAQVHSAAAADGRANALAAAQLAIDADDPDAATDALTISARASFSEGEAADPEKLALLREGLAMPGLSTLQQALLFGELAVELIMERDIAGRRAALAQRDRLLAGLPIVEQARLIASMGQVSFASISPENARHRIALLLAAPTDGVTPSARRRRASALAFIAMSAGDRAVMDDAFAYVQRARMDMPAALEPNDFIVANVMHKIDGHLGRLNDIGHLIDDATLDRPDATVATRPRPGS